MSTCLFLSFRLRADAFVSNGELAKLNNMLRATPALSKALIHLPARASDPYLDDGAPPQLVLQLYFAQLPELEAALARDGHLSVLLSRDEFPALTHADATAQAMLVRPFTVPEPSVATGYPYCTYLVSYEGEAEDLNAWLGHYLGKHIGHMTQLPGLRELEVYTRLDWISVLPFPRVNYMQRNKVAFDCAEALTRALNSPARHRMREDYHAFPPFTGGNTQLRHDDANGEIPPRRGGWPTPALSRGRPGGVIDLQTHYRVGPHPPPGRLRYARSQVYAGCVNLPAPSTLPSPSRIYPTWADFRCRTRASPSSVGRDFCAAASAECQGGSSPPRPPH